MTRSSIIILSLSFLITASYYNYTHAVETDKYDKKNEFLSFNFKQYQNKDPYDLQEEHFKFFKEGNLPKAAETFIAAAFCGYGDNEDYLLKLNPQSMNYFQSKDSTEVGKLVEMVLKELQGQHNARNQKSFEPIEIPTKEDDYFGKIQKAID